MSLSKTLIEVDLPSGDGIAVVRRRFGARSGGDGGGRRVAIVAGIRGDAPEGIRVAHQVGCVLAACEERLAGVVDIYPCANPLAAHSGARLWPFFDLDLNRLFPGRMDGHPPHRVAHALVQDITGADLVIELRGARPAFREATQAHVKAGDDRAIELAMGSNTTVVWVRHPGPAAAGTFAHQFDDTIVLEGGAGNRLTEGVGEDLSNGVLHLLSQIGVLDEVDLPFHWAGLQRPLLVRDDQVRRVRAQRGGLFLPRWSSWAQVSQGDSLGDVIDPSSGDTLEQVQSPVSGRLLAVREQPVVLPGTMVARVVTG